VAALGAFALLLAALPGLASAEGFTPAPALTPIDPQHWQDQQTMTRGDYKPIPGFDWASSGAQPTQRSVTIALVAFDFDDQPFVITQPKGSDPFGNPQIDPVKRADVPQFYADFFGKPEALNGYQTINGYWMEQSGGKIGVTHIDTFGPYRMPKKFYQYGLNDIGQNHAGCGASSCGPQSSGDGCPAQTTITAGGSSTTTIDVADSSFFYVGDQITIAGIKGLQNVTAIPDGTHITVASPISPANASAVEDCAGSNFDTDATNLWHAQAGCTGNCGDTIHLFMYAGYDETSVWQEFGEMMFQSKEDVPKAVWGNPNPKLPDWVLSRYVDWTSWFAGEQQWGESSVRQGESSGTITHELSHNLFTVGDNNNNPYVTPYHRVGSGAWDMMDRGSFNGPGGPHNRWEVPATEGASMGAEHMLRSKIGMGFVPPSTVMRVNRDGLAKDGVAVADVIARAVNADPLPSGSRAGIQVELDGATPIDHEPACDINTNPLCDGGGPSGGWANYSIETVQRIGYGSFEPDSGVLIAKNKPWDAGGRSIEGTTCGYSCFTWVEDAHPEDMDMVDYYSPNGTPVMRTIADYRQLDDALFHAGTDSGSKNEYDDTANDLKFYVIENYTDDKGYLHYVIGVQNPTGAGPQTRGVAVANAPAEQVSSSNANCRFQLTNTGADAATDQSVNPQDESLSFHNDVYKLSTSASGDGWSAQLYNDLATARFGDTVSVPVYVTRTAAAAAGGTITLTATSVSDASKTATATCAVTAPSTTVGGTVAPTLALELGGAADFGSFTPGVARSYQTSETATVVSTAGDATLSVVDPSATTPGHLVNGSFALAAPLQAKAASGAASGGDYADVGGTPLGLLTWTAPVANDGVTIGFSQAIGANEALRTGAYGKTLTFTLATTTP